MMRKGRLSTLIKWKFFLHNFGRQKGRQGEMNSRRRNLINWKLFGGRGTVDGQREAPEKFSLSEPSPVRCSRAPQSKTMSNFSSRKIFNLMASPVARSWEVSSKANAVVPCRRKKGEKSGWKSSLSEFTNKFHQVVAYAVHFKDDLSVLSAKITNYDARQIRTLGDGTLGGGDEAVQARREVHLPNDVVVDIDELFARQNLAFPLQWKTALSSVCRCDYVELSVSSLVQG